MYPPREVTVTRKFAASDGDRVTFTGELRTQILGETKLGGQSVTVRSSGTTDGSWTLNGGIIQSARIQLRSTTSIQ